MGDVIYLSDRLAARGRGTPATRPAFFFDLACPLSYLAGERIERELGDVEWIPAMLPGPGPNRSYSLSVGARTNAETLAIALRIPLVWPEGFRAQYPRAMRAACHAAELGAGSPFALAAGRLAFCGGFDLDDPEILAEAAAAAGIQPECSLAAAADPAYDVDLQVTARRLSGAGVAQLPAICSDGQWLDAEAAVAEALGLQPSRRFSRG